jgi:hypothetical protein
MHRTRIENNGRERQDTENTSVCVTQNKIIYRQYNIQVYASQNRNNGQKENTGAYVTQNRNNTHTRIVIVVCYRARIASVAMQARVGWLVKVICCAGLRDRVVYVPL